MLSRVLRQALLHQLGHAALTTWTHAAACCAVRICLQEHIVGMLMAQQDSARNMQLLVGLNAFALLLLLGFSGGWTATIAAGCILAALLYVLGLGAVGWMRQPAAAAEAVSLRCSSVTLARGTEQPLRKASRSLGGATAAVSARRIPCSHALAHACWVLLQLSSTFGTRHNCSSTTHCSGAWRQCPCRLPERLLPLPAPRWAVPCCATAQGVEVPGTLGDSVHNRSDGEHDSDEAEDLEDAIPYSEDFDDWPDAPVMLCPDPAAAHQVMSAGWRCRCWCWWRLRACRSVHLCPVLAVSVQLL